MMDNFDDEGFPPLRVIRKTGAESFHFDDNSIEIALVDFWRWAASDLVSNAMRGVLAEYIVACALGLAEGVRSEWEAYDLCTSEGIRIEVKSASYLQSWFHRKLSRIVFDIRPTQHWDPATNSVSPQRQRQSNLYIFCVLEHKDKNTLDPLNLKQWDFYVLPLNLLPVKRLAES